MLLGKLQIWEDVTWEIDTWEVTLGKLPLGKYLIDILSDPSSMEWHCLEWHCLEWHCLEWHCILYRVVLYRVTLYRVALYRFKNNTLKALYDQTWEKIFMFSFWKLDSFNCIFSTKWLSDILQQNSGRKWHNSTFYDKFHRIGDTTLKINGHLKFEWQSI